MALLLSLKNSCCFIIGSSVLVTQLSLTLCNSMDCSLSGASVHGVLQGRITGEGSHSLLQGIFLTQGSNPGFLHCIQFPYCLSHQGTPAGRRRKVCLTRAAQVARVVTNHPVQERWETGVRSLGWGKIPWRRARQPTPVFLPGKFHGRRTLAHEESDRTEVTEPSIAQSGCF